MKPGDIVLLTIGSFTHNAIVLHAHAGQPQLLGKNGEPLLHVAFIAPERESAIQRAKFGYIPQIFTEYDIVHHSQAFSDEQKKALGISSPAQLAQARGQGEWKEVKLTVAPGPVNPPAPPSHDAPQNDAPLDDLADKLAAAINQVPDPNPTQE